MIRTAIVLALTVLCLLNVSRAMAIERSELQLASVNAAVAYADDEGLVYGKNADRRVPIASGISSPKLDRCPSNLGFQIPNSMVDC